MEDPALLHAACLCPHSSLPLPDQWFHHSLRSCGRHRPQLGIHTTHPGYILGYGQLGKKKEVAGTWGGKGVIREHGKDIVTVFFLLSLFLSTGEFSE